MAGTEKHPKRIGLYVIYDRDGILDGFREYYIEKVSKHIDRFIAVVCGEFKPEELAKLETMVDEVYCRENTGLLAGAWVDGINHIGWDALEEYDELFMLNDSFFGPFFEMDDFMDAMERSDCDFYGALRNFEDEKLTQMSGRTFKHGHFRGSIQYFYVIKDRLLHSKEFRKYWSKMPEVKESWDTYFFAEFDFYDYVLDNGFKIDAYQSDRLKGYYFDNLTHNIAKLISQDKIPFARIRPFGNDMRYVLEASHGEDPRKALEYIDKHTDYDVNLIWDYILRVYDLVDIYNQLQLDYVVSHDTVEAEKPYDKKFAVVLHIYYCDQVDVLIDYCDNFPPNAEFFITTTTEETKRHIDEVFGSHGLHFESVIRPNVGVAMSSLWITYRDKLLNGGYEFAFYFHDKKSPYSNCMMHGEQFGYRCFENLIGSRATILNILDLMVKNPRMGVLGPPMVYHGLYYNTPTASWPLNYDNTVALAKDLGLNVRFSKEKYPVAPYGDMMWFRVDALRKALGRNYTYEDFTIDYKPDGTFFHAIERIYGYAAQDSGYYYADVTNSDFARTDIANYQYMLYKQNEVLFKYGFPVCGFNNEMNVLRYVTQVAGNKADDDRLLLLQDDRYSWKDFVKELIRRLMFNLRK